jgi:adenosyl cobinamide kinase/adenosyl cobinamide phosphate guanylyltransferase
MEVEHIMPWRMDDPNYKPWTGRFGIDHEGDKWIVTHQNRRTNHVYDSKEEAQNYIDGVKQATATHHPEHEDRPLHWWFR